MPQAAMPAAKIANIACWKPSDQPPTGLPAQGPNQNARLSFSTDRPEHASVRTIEHRSLGKIGRHRQTAVYATYCP